MITDPKRIDGFMGMSMDLDLVKGLGRGRTGARRRTGTIY